MDHENKIAESAPVFDYEKRLTEVQRECTRLLLENRILRSCVPSAPSETPETIAQWAVETLGPSVSNMRVAVRANEELAELLRALSIDDNSEEALMECADVICVLFRLVVNLGGSVDEIVNRKMAINRAHSLHRERHELSKMYRAVCSCGWHSPEFIRTGDYNATRTDHLSEIIEKAVKTIRSHG